MIIEFVVDGQDTDLTLEAQRQPPNTLIWIEVDLWTGSSLPPVNSEMISMI